MTGFEPATLRLEVSRAIQLRHTDFKKIICILGEGFEPTKQMHTILSRAPLTRLGYPSLSLSLNYDESILF